MEYRDVLFEEKERAWKQQEQEVNQLVDGLGKRIDAGIKEGVIALRVLGFHTAASCEGHIGRGLPGPWIDVGDIPDDIRRLFLKTRREPTKSNEREKALIQEAIQEAIREKARLVELLTEFYDDRKVPYDQQLILLHPIGDTSRVISQGTEVYRAYDLTVQAERMKRYQEEMKAFTEFAKNKFFSGID